MREMMSEEKKDVEEFEQDYETNWFEKKEEELKLPSLKLPKIELSKSKFWLVGGVIGVLIIVAVLSGFLKPGSTGEFVTTTLAAGEVGMSVLNDPSCGACNASPIIDSLKTQIFPNLVVEEIDYNSAKGKELAEELEIETLPAFIFGKAVEDATNYNQISRYLDQKGDKYVLRVGGNLILGREEIKKKIDLFVMSFCPYGVKAENNMKEVLDVLDIDFNVHFIATKTTDGFSSLHGQKEVDEDMRQACALEKYPDKAFDYILCINKKIEENNFAELTEEQWSSCSEDVGIPSDGLKECFEKEGSKLLEESINKTEELMVGSSPTFLINNRITFTGALPPETIKNNICGENELTGCEKTLSSGSSSTSGKC